MQNKIRIPNNWGPRAYQMDVWRYLERGGKRAIWICELSKSRSLAATRDAKRGAGRNQIWFQFSPLHARRMATCTP